jgi:hypothetical protein
LLIHAKFDNIIGLFSLLIVAFMGSENIRNFLASMEAESYIRRTSLFSESGAKVLGEIEISGGKRAKLSTSSGAVIICHINNILNLSEGEVGTVDLKSTKTLLGDSINAILESNLDLTGNTYNKIDLSTALYNPVYIHEDKLDPENKKAADAVLDYAQKTLEKFTGRSMFGAEIGIHGITLNTVEDICHKIIRIKKNCDLNSSENQKELRRLLDDAARKLLAHYFGETENWLNFENSELCQTDVGSSIERLITSEENERRDAEEKHRHFYPSQALGYYRRLIREGKLVCLNSEQAEALKLTPGEHLLSNGVRIIIFS